MFRNNKKNKNKKINNPINRLNRMLEVPEELITNEPKITVIGFKKILIENYKAILEYQDIFIKIKTYTGFIDISGFNLKLDEMNSDDIMVIGVIEDIEFEKIE